MSGKLIVICGPTASGKTALSVDVAQALNAKIVSADSMQIYKEMNIGTAKPYESEKRGIPHYMMDVVSVTEDYNVSRYVNDAGACIDSLLSQNENVVLVGGTGLYIDSLINNTNFFEIDNDFNYRDEMMKIAAEKGNAYLLSELTKVDPISADRLHENDIKRVIRALEVHHVTGIPISEFQKESIRNRKYDPLFIGLNYRDRNVLYNRIEKRVDIMIEQGLLDEAAALLNIELSTTARAAIGYSDVFDCIEGKCSLEDSVASIKKKTRNYAKRQLTWFRRNKEINWFYPDDYNDYTELLSDVLSLINAECEVKF